MQNNKIVLYASEHKMIQKVFNGCFDAEYTVAKAAYKAAKDLPIRGDDLLTTMDHGISILRKEIYATGFNDVPPNRFTQVLHSDFLKVCAGPLHHVPEDVVRNYIMYDDDDIYLTISGMYGMFGNDDIPGEEQIALIEKCAEDISRYLETHDALNSYTNAANKLEAGMVFFDLVMSNALHVSDSSLFSEENIIKWMESDNKLLQAAGAGALAARGSKDVPLSKALEKLLVDSIRENQTFLLARACEYVTVSKDVLNQLIDIARMHEDVLLSQKRGLDVVANDAYIISCLCRHLPVSDLTEDEIVSIVESIADCGRMLTKECIDHKELFAFAYLYYGEEGKLESIKNQFYHLMNVMYRKNLGSMLQRLSDDTIWKWLKRVAPYPMLAYYACSWRSIPDDMAKHLLIRSTLLEQPAKNDLFHLLLQVLPTLTFSPAVWDDVIKERPGYMKPYKSLQPDSTDALVQYFMRNCPSDDMLLAWLCSGDEVMETVAGRYVLEIALDGKTIPEPVLDVIMQHGGDPCDPRIGVIREILMDQKNFVTCSLSRCIRTYKDDGRPRNCPPIDLINWALAQSDDGLKITALHACQPYFIEKDILDSAASDPDKGLREAAMLACCDAQKKEIPA